ncbi:hypothetical protein NON00_08125 [Roseomonas sp. GC11]|uniref:hypothetical protein n=1 Tax=Roseomonas sp. GC11 TaxID=2950546 RepID=UPI00210AB19D|nr:hypothetical protein [Roseomonas sp. GC11]MCQ4159894.1 hypothetical protein [Roseomonas sp. GC11]
MAQAEMWGTYLFRGLRVRVIQQWSDPFGVRMVRIEMAAGEDDRAEGMPEEAFLREAAACPPAGGGRP